MKRAGYLYQQTYTTEICEKAYAGVMKGKHRKYDPNSIAFMIRMNNDYYIRETGRILYERSFKPSKPHESMRYDKGSNKLRKIQAPRIFPDQFVHWAVVLVLLPYLERGMDDFCCASVKGRGTDYAKRIIEKTLDDSLDDKRKYHDKTHVKYKYCLKMDIKKFFQNIDRDIMMSKLARLTKDKEFLDLCGKIIYSVPGTGLPLGYYTSQWFANYYLQSFDHYLREVLMPKYSMSFYIRYMDDMIILGSNKRKLNQLKDEIDTYLRKELKLWLKPNSAVFAIENHPIDFIGYQFGYGQITLRKRIIHKMKIANDKLYQGKFTIKKLSRNNAYHGWLQTSKTRNYEKNNLQGSRSLENHKYKELVNKQREEYENSKTKKHLDKLTEEIINLKAIESGNNAVLTRYYPSTDSVRIVARSTFEFPDKKEYEAKKAALAKQLEEEKAERKKARYKRQQEKRRKKGNHNYYPTADIFIDNKDAKEVRENYNNEIRLSTELEYLTVDLV